MQQKLVKVGWYEQFEAKRVIIRQGHKADNFYLILSGTAIVTVLDVDPKTGQSFSKTVAFLGKGNSFGVSRENYILKISVTLINFLNIFIGIGFNAWWNKKRNSYM